MIPYEEFLPLLPHEYSYAQYLSYGFDLCMYDPMILNMVSERYPRDEDYASDSDSDMITDEDFDFDVPPWLFQDLEDEDGSLIQKEHDHLNIVFGSFDSFDQDSDLETIAVAAPLISIQPECDEFTIQIGEILCSLSAVKQRNDGGSFEKVAATQSLDLESNTMDLQSNTTEEIKTGCIFDFTSDFNSCTKDEARIDSCKSTDLDLVKRLQKDAVISEIVPTSRFGSNMIFNASNAPSLTVPEVKTKEKSQHIVTEENDFFNCASEIVTPFKRVLQVPNQFLFSKTVLLASSGPDPVNVSHHDFAFGCNDWIDFDFTAPDHFLAILAAADDFVCPKSIPNFFVFNRSVFVWLDFIFTAPDRSISFVGDGNQATSIESRRKQEVVPRNPPAPPLFTTVLLWSDFIFAKSFLNLAVLEEMVKEMEEDTASPEPPWELLCHGLQPHDMTTERSRAPSRNFWSAFAFSVVATAFCVVAHQLGQHWANVHSSHMQRGSSCFGPILVNLISLVNGVS